MGCQTMQSWLNTGDDTAQVHSSSLAQRATPENLHELEPVEASEATTRIALERARAYAQGRADAIAPSADSEASLRTLKRQKRKPAVNPLELVDPTVAKARVKLDERIQSAYSISLGEDDRAQIFTGNFSTQTGNELVVLRPGKDIVAYSTDERVARLDLAGDAAPEAFAELGLDLDPSGIEAVELVHDDTLQLLLHWRVKTEAGDFAYKMSVLKVIGPFFAHVFTRTLATSKTKDGPLHRVGTYEVLSGTANRDIRWIPANEAGKLQVSKAVVLKWNKWEGMYRVPGPPAAAPKRKNLHASETPNTAASHPPRATLAQRYLSENPR